MKRLYLLLLLMSGSAMAMTPFPFHLLPPEIAAASLAQRAAHEENLEEAILKLKPTVLGNSRFNNSQEFALALLNELAKVFDTHPMVVAAKFKTPQDITPPTVAAVFKTPNTTTAIENLFNKWQDNIKKQINSRIANNQPISIRYLLFSPAEQALIVAGSIGNFQAIFVTKVNSDDNIDSQFAAQNQPNLAIGNIQNLNTQNNIITYSSPNAFINRMQWLSLYFDTVTNIPPFVMIFSDNVVAHEAVEIRSNGVPFDTNALPPVIIRSGEATPLQKKVLARYEPDREANIKYTKGSYYLGNKGYLKADE